MRLIELHGLLSTDLGASESEGVNFNFKARPAADGIGLEEDAILTRATFETSVSAAREGAGSVVLRGTVHDPLDELPVRAVLRGVFMECDLIGSCEAVATRTRGRVPPLPPWPPRRLGGARQRVGRRGAGGLRPMDTVVIAGVGMTRFAKVPEGLRPRRRGGLGGARRFGGIGSRRSRPPTSATPSPGS